MTRRLSLGVISVVLLLVGSSILVSACGDASGDRGSETSNSSTAAGTETSETPTDVAEIDLAGLDVEMHYAVG